MALYLAAAKVLEASESHDSTLKTLIYDSDFQEKGALTAVTLETQRHLPIIEKVLNVSGAEKSNVELSKWMLRVVTYDLLFGQGLKAFGIGSIRRAIRPQQRALKDALRKLKEEMGVTRNEELLQKYGIIVKEDPMPRWARVNLLKNTYQEVEDELINEGFTCIVKRQEVEKLVEDKSTGKISSLMIEYIDSLKQDQFMADFHLPDVLVFAPKTHLFGHSLYKENRIILMDKSSCIPAYVLAPPEGSEVIDSCAAPGNKTSHLGCMMNNTGKIYAFDLDKKRADLLSRTVSRTGTNAEVTCSDFLDVDPSDPKYSRISHILVDPSCSGSGIVSRKDHIMGHHDKGYRSRLKYLRGIQLRILNHALNFPNVKRIVYSTCSINSEENEEVVLKILETHDDVKLKKVLPAWDHRPTLQMQEDGDDEYGDNGHKDLAFLERRKELKRSINKNCIKASLERDRTNGFFVALLSRKRGRPVEEGWESDSREDTFMGVEDGEVKNQIDLEETGDSVRDETYEMSNNRVSSGKTKIPCSSANECEELSLTGEGDGRKIKKKKKKMKEKDGDHESKRDWLDLIDEVEDGGRKMKKRKKDSGGSTELTSAPADESDVVKLKKGKKPKRNVDHRTEENAADDGRCKIKERKTEDENVKLNLDFVIQDDVEKSNRKKEKKKKEKKRKKDSDGFKETTSTTGDESDVISIEKEKKSTESIDHNIEENEACEESVQLKERKRKVDNLKVNNDSEIKDVEESIKSKKGKKKKKGNRDSIAYNSGEDRVGERGDIKEGKKRKVEDNGVSNFNMNETVGEEDVVRKKKKKKKDRESSAAC